MQKIEEKLNEILALEQVVEDASLRKLITEGIPECLELLKQRSYAVWFDDAQDGCDYYIGCGEKLVPLKNCPTMDHAINWLQRAMSPSEDSTRGEWGEDDEQMYKNVIILEVASTVHVDLVASRAIVKAKQDEDDRVAKEAAERAEYERLKAKMEGSET